MAGEASDGEPVEKDMMDLALVVDARMTDLDPAAPRAAFTAQGKRRMGWRFVNHRRPIPRLGARKKLIFFPAGRFMKDEGIVNLFVPIPKMKPGQRILDESHAPGNPR